MKGFTLLEVMIALALVAGVLLSVIVSFNYHLDVARRDREETVAMLLARAKLEEPGFATQTADRGSFAPSWPEFGWQRTVTATDFPGIDRLTLTVTWDGAGRSLGLVRYVER